MQFDFRFKYTEDHLVTSFLRYKRQIAWRMPFIGLKWFLAVCLSLPTLFFIVKGYVFPAATFGAILGILFIGQPVDIWLMRKRFRKSPFRDDEIAYSISDSGVHVIGRDSETRAGWSSFTKARRFADGLLLFQGPSFFTWLPDGAATDTAAISTMLEVARSKIQDFREV